MRLYVLRHGQAHPGWPDEPRQLMEEGRAEVRKVVAKRATDLDGLEAIVTSPLTRAQQTAAEAIAVLNWRGDLLQTDCITPEGSIVECCHFLEQVAADAVMLVSHQPFVGELIAYLTSDISQSMKTGSLAALDVEYCARGGAELRWIEHP